MTFELSDPEGLECHTALEVEFCALATHCSPSDQVDEMATAPGKHKKFAH